MKIGIKIFLFAAFLTLSSFGLGKVADGDFLQEAIALLALLAVSTAIFSRHLTQPLKQLMHWLSLAAQESLQNKTTLEFPEASLDRVAIRQDEIGEISRQIQTIKTHLVGSIQHLQNTTAEKERMETELRIGRSIQMDLLALGPANFPNHEDLNIFAFLQPAREVGGDFYDCYFIPEQLSNLLREYCYRFCFCIGDTSGKGVPAALFTTVMKTMIKSQSYVDISPAKILTRVNQIISENNPSCMFTTIFMGILNVLNGELVYTCAGHNPPYLRLGDGSLKRLDEIHGPAVGVIDGVEYKESKILLATGDVLITYTDGITEAMDVDGNLFSEERLLDLLQSKNCSSPQEVIHITIEAVSQFQDQAEQADDITMLSFKYVGNPIEAEEFSEFSILEAALSKIKGKRSLSGGIDAIFSGENEEAVTS